jgi:hypothetical protein
MAGLFKRYQRKGFQNCLQADTNGKRATLISVATFRNPVERVLSSLFYFVPGEIESQVRFF